ncbi:MAG: VOC family protein [Vicingaceae bacterium]
MSTSKFHISLPCKDIQATKKFYEKDLGLKIGRKSYHWFDVDLFGNQITFTFDDKSVLNSKKYSFEEIMLPSFHYGIILEQERWEELFLKFKDEDFFAIGTKKFLKNKKGEHQSFFITDINGYFIEFKNFSELDEIFEQDE